MTDEKPTVTIYTDGGADPNPGPGGYGVVLIYEVDDKQHIKELSGGVEETTNNRMELTAVIEGLRALKRPCTVELYTDSQYVQKGITEWMPKWLRTDFKKGKIQNTDLWQILNTEIARHEIHWHWVKGHAGNIHNERADELAASARPGAVNIQSPSLTRIYLRISCLGAPGIGAWAALIVRPDGDTLLSGGLTHTQANRLDLLGAIGALETIPEGTEAVVYTANSYLRDGISRWVQGWKKNNWLKKSGGEVQYRTLWQRLDALAEQRRIRWFLVSSDERPPEMERLEKPLQQAIEAARHAAPDKPSEGG